MTEHRTWCPARDGGACACAEVRDTKTMNLFGEPANTGGGSDYMAGSGGGWGIGATIVEALRGYGHAGARAETLRAEARRMMDGVDDDAIDAALEQLQQDGEVGEGTNGPGFLALADLVRAHAAEEMEAEGASGGPASLDTLPVLAALQLLGDAGGSVEELQREIEAAGSGRHPLGRVFAVALALVEAGKARREGADEPEARFWLVTDSPVAVLERRTRLVQQLAQAVVDLEREDDERCGAMLLSEIAAAGGTREDIDALITAGVVIERESHGDDDEAADRDPAYELKSDAFGEVLRIGAVALASRTVESPVASGGAVLRLAPDAPAGADAPAVDATGFERAAVEKAELERKRADALQAQINTMRENLRRAELNPDWFSAPPPSAKPAEEIVEFKERRIVDMAEKGVILEEILAIKRRIASAEAEFGILKSEHKAKVEELQKELKELEEASESNARTVIIQARHERDWAAGVLRVVAVDDGRVLQEKPLPKGEQRTIPGTEAPPVAAPSEGNPTAAASQEAIDNFKQAFAEKNGQPAPAAESAPGAAPAPTTASSLIVDVAALPALERDVYEALRKANRPVTTAGLPDAVKAATGKTVGPAMRAKIEAAAAALVERCVAVREGDAFRVLGAPATAAPVKSAKERIWDALDGEPKTKGELRLQAGVTEEEIDEVLAALKKAGKVATSGKAKGTKYARAGAPGPEATV
ncbi:hypothetical protein [Sorangium sp. So ce233]|uniref:hypothetical protein n=1 Tax=Sorangium sp. So ce233 TaxID=3133290 RepID=UPI003F636427